MPACREHLRAEALPSIQLGDLVTVDRAGNQLIAVAHQGPQLFVHTLVDGAPAWESLPPRTLTGLAATDDDSAAPAVIGSANDSHLLVMVRTKTGWQTLVLELATGKWTDGAQAPPSPKWDERYVGDFAILVPRSRCGASRFEGTLLLDLKNPTAFVRPRNPPAARMFAPVMDVVDGRLVVAGGHEPAEPELKSGECDIEEGPALGSGSVLDPARTAWTPLPAGPPDSAFFHGVVSARHVFVYGPAHDAPLWRYEIRSNAWSQLGASPFADRVRLRHEVRVGSAVAIGSLDPRQLLVLDPERGLRDAGEYPVEGSFNVIGSRLLLVPYDKSDRLYLGSLDATSWCELRWPNTVDPQAVRYAFSVPVGDGAIFFDNTTARGYRVSLD